MIAFTLNRDGRISDAGIRRNSGNDGLDAAALAAVTDIGQFRPFPEHSTRQHWTMALEVVFALE